MAEIILKQINKTFSSAEKIKVEAVKEVDLHINNGEIFGIIGFSGAGKSTLVRCINLLERPTSGQVMVDGIELTSLNEKQLRNMRKKIGMIFQHFNLLGSRTVFQNIAYPLKGSGLNKQEIAEKVQSMLDLVDLRDKENAYPSQLSGGQKQRVAIARALVNDPKVLLCDEATSALDPQTTLSILKLIKMLNEKLGITIVIITHEMNVVKEVCHKVAVMEQGRIVEQGDVFSIFSNPKQEVTKDFIQTTSNLHKIYTLIEEGSPVVNLKPGELLVQLTYTEKNVVEAIVSTVSREFTVDISIIFGNLEIIQNAPIGGLVAKVSGDQENINLAVSYMREKNVRVEVIANGFNT